MTAAPSSPLLADMANLTIDTNSIALPPELWKIIIEFIVPDPTAPPFWTALQRISLDYGPHRKDELAQIAAMPCSLRALSQTCHLLRVLALPFSRKFACPQVIEVRTIGELGCLRESFRLCPNLARYVRSFTFGWKLPAGAEQVWDYPEEQGTVLDFCFRDRWEMWNSYARVTGSSIRIEEYDEGHTRRFFRIGRREFREPIVVENQLPSGPDGRGEDALIESSDQLVSCVVEIVEKLTLLHTFAWKCNITALPTGAFEALEKLKTLRTFKAHTRIRRDVVSLLPFWRLVDNLEELSIRQFADNFDPCEADKGHDEATLAAYELPTQLPPLLNTGQEHEEYERMRINCAITTRTIIAAVRNGHLRRLVIDVVHSAFAVASLLPCWVDVSIGSPNPHNQWYGWCGAGRQLRLLLSHASLWVVNDTRKGPTLTRQHVQSLRSHFSEKERLPFTLPAHWSETKQPIEMYLPWLEKDAELAEQVAQAWNAVVQRGDANVVRCRCEKCVSYYSL